MQVITLKNNMISHADIFAYPDGQRMLTLKLNELSKKKPVYIKCRITEHWDLELLSLLVGALKSHDFYIKQIEYIYLYGMRSDRIFHPGQANYFEQVIKPIIESYPVEKYFFFFPHSYRNCLHAQQNNGVFKTEFECDFFIDDFVNPTTFDDIVTGDGEKVITVEADESAGMNFENWHSGMHFEKHRTSQDEMHIRLKDEWFAKLHDSKLPILIVDDLCDGGATFVKIGEFLRKHLGEERELRLAVAHGLFSKGFDELRKYYKVIYTTNSYMDFHESDSDEWLKVMKVI